MSRPDQSVAKCRATGEASFLRFFVASAGGLVLDLALAYALSTFFDWPLIACATVSLVIAAAVMYFVHEFWTFRGAAGKASLGRLTGTVLSAITALAVRALILYALAQLTGLGDRYALVQLALATATSFLVNYVLVRRIVGQAPAARPADLS